MSRLICCVALEGRGGFRISGKGFIYIKVGGGGGGGGCFADIISFLLIISMIPNYFIFLGYLKTGAGRGVRANPL